MATQIKIRNTPVETISIRTYEVDSQDRLIIRTTDNVVITFTKSPSGFYARSNLGSSDYFNGRPAYRRVHYSVIERTIIPGGPVVVRDDIYYDNPNLFRAYSVRDRRTYTTSGVPLGGSYRQAGAYATAMQLAFDRNGRFTAGRFIVGSGRNRETVEVQFRLEGQVVTRDRHGVITAFQAVTVDGRRISVRSPSGTEPVIITFR